jgi:hypothetical protein
MLAKREAAAEQEKQESDKENAESTPDILGEQEDEDVIF